MPRTARSRVPPGSPGLAGVVPRGRSASTKVRRPDHAADVEIECPGPCSGMWSGGDVGWHAARREERGGAPSRGGTTRRPQRGRRANRNSRTEIRTGLQFVSRSFILWRVGISDIDKLVGEVARLGSRSRRSHARELSDLVAAGGTRRGLIGQIAMSGDHPVERRCFACWCLGRLGGSQAERVLLELFKSRRGRVGRQAANSLSGICSGRSISDVITILIEDQVVWRRKFAAYILGWSHSRRVVEPLIRALRSGEGSTCVRAYAAEALGNLGFRKASPALREALGDGAAAVRFWSAFSLGKLRDFAAIPALERLARNDRRSVRGWWSIAKEAKNAIRIIRDAGRIG